MVRDGRAFPWATSIIVWHGRRQGKLAAGRYSIPQRESAPAIFAGVGGAKSRRTCRVAETNRPAQHVGQLAGFIFITQITQVQAFRN
jgi:hypothetical protein